MVSRTPARSSTGAGVDVAEGAVATGSEPVPAADPGAEPGGAGRAGAEPAGVGNGRGAARPDVEAQADVSTGKTHTAQARWPGKRIIVPEYRLEARL